MSRYIEKQTDRYRQIKQIKVSEREREKQRKRERERGEGRYMNV